MTNKSVLVTGIFTLSIDDRGRVMIPKSIRDKFADGLRICFAPDHTLYIFPEANWQNRYNHLIELSDFDPNTLKEKERIGGGLESKIDNLGRVVIDKTYSKYAELDNEAVLYGITDGFRVWNSTSFDNYNNATEVSYLKSGTGGGNE
jgi:MraZ protein